MDYQGYFDSFLAFEKKWVKRWLYSEMTVYSETHRYAGSTDNIAEVHFPGEPEPEPTIIDYKTSGRLQKDSSLQLVAYGKADWMTFDGKGDRMYDIPQCKKGIVIRLGPDGKYTAKPYRLDEVLFEVFLDALGVAQRKHAIAACEMKALNSRPRKELR